MSPRYWLPVVVIGSTLATSAHAGPLTFQAALDLAKANAPSLKARALEVDAARSAAKAAGVLPDPHLRLGLENLPFTGPEVGSLTADEMTMATVGYTQDMPNRASRDAQRVRAGADVAVAQAQVEIEARRVRLATALAWIDLYYAQKRVDALDGVLTTLEPLWDAQPSAVTSGASRPAEALTPIRMKAGLEDRRAELEAAVGRARADLMRWTGDLDPAVVGSPPSMESLDPAALRAGIDHHSTLLAYAASADRASADLDLATADTRSNWSWDVSVGHRAPRFGDMVSAGVSMSLPIRKATRQNPLIAARLSEVARVSAEREETRRELAAGLEGDLADHVMHHDQWRRSLTVLLPNAQRRADLETASYGAGTASLSQVLEAFNLLADTKLDVLEREAAVAHDAQRIVITYGSDRL